MCLPKFHDTSNFIILSKSIFTVFLNYFSLWINTLVINQGDEPENENAIIENQEKLFSFTQDRSVLILLLV